MNKTVNYKIAVVGLMGSGKDVVGDYLISKYGFTRYAFADEVKKVAKEYFPEEYGDENNKPRKLLQDVGTMFRRINKQIWVNKLLKNVKKDEKDAIKCGFYLPNIIITDCRMPNEYEALKNEGYKFIAVTTSDEIRLDRLRERGDSFSLEDLHHDSEKHIGEFSWDYLISNETSLQHVYDEIDKIITSITKEVRET